MKFIITIASFLIILSSCGSRTAKIPSKPANDLIQRFKPFLHGVWISADYLDDIVKTRSPYKSKERLTFITEMVIDTFGISADSMRVNMALGNHEGSDFILFFKEGKTPASLLTGMKDFEQDSDSYELGYEINSKDTALMIYHYDKNKKLLGKIRYFKVGEVSHGGSLEDGFQYMVNKKLMTGSYKVTDSAGVERSVRMTNDGIITGLPGFNTYYVITDFVASPEDNTDILCFDIQTGQQRCYAFEITSDTVNLFRAPEAETDTLFKAGPLLYKFVKQL